MEMSDLSISDKQERSPKARSYRMRRRAEQVDETRQRITEAAVRLHTSVGPAHTSISSVAEEADVTRLTVYRHFADLDALFLACMGHWSAINPLPDAEPWMEIEPLEARARQAFGDLYRWYEARHEELYPIDRDFSAMPGSAQQALATQDAAIAAVILGSTSGDDRAAHPNRILAAVARHLVDFRTWRSLTIEGGLESSEAADAAVAMLLAAYD
jgi:AcrR family transcriptional regulator